MEECYFCFLNCANITKSWKASCFNPNKTGLFEGIVCRFFLKRRGGGGGGGNLSPPSYIKEN